MKKLALVLMAVSVISLSAFGSAYAASLTAEQISSIMNLLQSFGASQEIVNNVQVSLEGKTPSVNASVTAWCNSFTKDMGVNISSVSDDVSALQYILQKEGLLSTVDSDKGTFNEEVASAVVQFQAKYGIKQTGYVGPLTRGKLNQLYGCKKIVPPVQTSITVLSPNGGESWQKGTTQTIKWQDSSPVPACPTVQNTTCANVADYYDIKLISYAAPCTSSICPMVAVPAPYVIAKAVAGASYNWSVGMTDNALVSNGSYTVQVCQTGTTVCDSSNSYFKIYSGVSSNLPPVIDGVTAPTTLSVGQTGTWTVKAHDPENGTLSYSVEWGDNVVGGTLPGYATSPTATQTSTFTHSYSIAGTYTVKFKVSDSSGLVAQTTASVQVGATVQPSVTILSPNGGEIFKKGSTFTTGDFLLYKVQVTGASSKGNISIYITDRNDATWRVGTNYWITDGIGFDPKATPTITDIGSTQINNSFKTGKYYLLAEWRGDDGAYSTDFSNSTFTIAENVASLKVVTPNGGETYTVGQTIPITWTSSGITGGVSVDVMSSDGTRMLMSTSLLNNPGSYNFGIAGGTAAGQYVVRVRATGASDQSDSAFTISPGTTQPLSLSLSADNTSNPPTSVNADSSNVSVLGLKMMANGGNVTIHGIQVSSSDSTITSKIAALKVYDGSTLLASVTAPHGTNSITHTVDYLLNFDSTIPNGGTKLLTLKADLMGGATGSFSFVTSGIVHSYGTSLSFPTGIYVYGPVINITAPSSITVLSPNGGETLVQTSVGQTTQNQIGWSGGPFSSVHVGLMTAGSTNTDRNQIGWIWDGTTSQNSIVWDGKTVCSGFNSGTGVGCFAIQPGTYKMYIGAYVTSSGLYVEDLGDSYFTITAAVDSARREQIRQLYLTLLYREPDAAGWDFWANGSLTIAQIESGIKASYEYTTEQSIAAIFREVLGREATAAEITSYYAKVYENGWTLAQVRAAITPSTSVTMTTGNNYYFKLPSGSITLDSLNLRQTDGFKSGVNLTDSDVLMFTNPDGSTVSYFYYTDATGAGWLDASYNAVSSILNEFLMVKKISTSMTWMYPSGTKFYGSDAAANTSWFNDFRIQYPSTQSASVYDALRLINPALYR